MRLVLAARLSKRRDGQSGVESQDEQARKWAERHGHEIVAVSVDHGVSGRVHPAERKGLGPWLSDPDKLAQFDGLLAYDVDRLSRSYRDTPWLRGWADDYGKHLYIVSDGLHWPDPDAGIIWGVKAELAEAEWQKTRERVTRDKNWRHSNGYLTGKPPYGYRVARRDDRGKTLEPDPEQAPKVRRLFEMVAEGESVRQAALSLGIRPMSAVQMISRYPHAYLGQRRNAAGDVVLRYEPIISAKLLRDAQKAMRLRGRMAKVPASGSLLGGLAVCGSCGGTMYAHGSARYRYYRCKGKPPKYQSACRNMIRQDFADHRADAFMMSLVVPYRERERIPGNDHADELAEVEADLAELPRRRLSDDDEDAERKRLRAERDRIASLPAEPDRFEWRDSDETFAKLWAECSTTAERRELLAGKVRFTVAEKKIRPCEVTGEYMGALPVAVPALRPHIGPGQPNSPVPVSLTRIGLFVCPGAIREAGRLPQGFFIRWSGCPEHER